MEDKACRKLMGIINNVMIKIDKLSFHVDFMVIDIEADLKNISF